jgi:hypothetical protein
MPTDITQAMPIINIVFGGAGAIFMGLVLWGLKSVISALYKAIIAVEILTGEMKELKETVKNLPKLESDLDAAHEKIRELKQEIKGEL